MLVGALINKLFLLLIFTLVPNAVLPTACGVVITCVLVNKLIPNSVNTLSPKTVNDNISFAGLNDLSISSITSLLSLVAIAWMLIKLLLFICVATELALPGVSVRLYPFNKIVLFVVILQALVPIIVPYFAPPFTKL